VELYVGKQVRRVLHPSVQVGGYQQWLLDNHSVFYEADAVALTAVSFLHNLSYDADGELWAHGGAQAHVASGSIVLVTDIAFGVIMPPSASDWRAKR
jgi:hypothetical protein